MLQDIPRRKYLRTRKLPDDLRCTEEVVTMAMRDHDATETLVGNGGVQPSRELGTLGDGGGGVDEKGFMGSVNQGESGRGEGEGGAVLVGDWVGWEVVDGHREVVVSENGGRGCGAGSPRDGGGGHG